jgi:hypothetical protein
MSRQDLNRLLADIEKDPSEWSKDPNAFMARYDLSGEEQAALRSDDPAALSALGVDERLAKIRAHK